MVAEQKKTQKRSNRKRRPSGPVTPESRPAVANTLAYFDPIYHAPRVHSTTLVTMSDDQLEPLRAAIDGPTEKYTLSHHGAVDHDWVDGWLARQLGAQPRARFRAHV